MREHLGLLKASSAAIKVAAWIFLLLGIFGAVTILSGVSGLYPRWLGFVVLGAYGFGFFLMQLIAKLADIVGALLKDKV